MGHYNINHYFYYFLILAPLISIMSVYTNSDPALGCNFKKLKTDPNCNEVKLYYPWTNSKTCNNYTVIIPPQGTYKPTALTTFPFSGASWLLQIIERSTGVIVGTVNKWVRIPDNPEHEIRCSVKVWDGRTIIYGTLDESSKILPLWLRKLDTFNGEDLDWPTVSKTLFNYRGILFIRNPWYTLINSRIETQRILRVCHESCRSRSSKHLEIYDFKHENFKSYFEKEAKRWVGQVKKWVINSPHGSEMLIIQYENMMIDPAPDVRRILKYLNVTIDEERLKCVFQDPTVHYEHFPVHNQKFLISSFFENNIDSVGTNILENGILEINEILRSKSILGNLNYKRPDYLDILKTSDDFITRKELHYSER